METPFINQDISFGYKKKIMKEKNIFVKWN